MVEHAAVNRGVVGSSPTFGANFIGEFDNLRPPDTLPTQKTPETAPADVKWPYKVKHRKNGPVLAKIYRPCAGRDSYRVAWSADGKRKMQSFPRFAGEGGAREFAERLARDLAQGSQAPSLSPAEARSALSIRDALQQFRVDTGRTVTPDQAVTDYLAAIRKLGDRPLSEAVSAFLDTVAIVKRVDLAAAIEEFTSARVAKSRSSDGRRAHLAVEYVTITGRYLHHFAKAFPGHAVCDIGKQHLDLFMSDPHRSQLAPKSRNHYRATLKMFLAWAVKKDYLPANHRLLEAPGMERETLTGGDTDFYRPAELRQLLAAADALRPIIAICSLAGLRVQEALRLTYEDLFRVPGHIEVTATKSKTRSRRLVEIVPALAEWLEPYRPCTGPLWPGTAPHYQVQFTKLRASLTIPSRKNGLRHAFCTYHFAAHGNENLTAQQAGNSPAMIHAHYKGLATKKEAQAWFAICPPPAAANLIAFPAGQTATAAS